MRVYCMRMYSLHNLVQTVVGRFWKASRYMIVRPCLGSVSPDITTWASRTHLGLLWRKESISCSVPSMAPGSVRCSPNFNSTCPSILLPSTVHLSSIRPSPKHPAFGRCSKQFGLLAMYPVFMFSQTVFSKHYSKHSFLFSRAEKQTPR